MKNKFRIALLIGFILLLNACASVPNPETGNATEEVPVATSPPKEEPNAKPQTPAVEPVRIEFGEGALVWYTNGDLVAEAAQQFVLTGIEGQQVTVWLSTDPISDDAGLKAAIEIIGVDGQSLSQSPDLYWSAILPSSGDYVVKVRSLYKEPITYQVVVERSASMIDPRMGTMYELIPDSLCEDLRGIASEALSVEFTAQTRAPFFDAIGGEAGQGCRLTAGGNGTQFANPADVVRTISNSVGLGWNPLTGYEADGPTGSAAGMSRDMALMLISANWQPDMGVTCPADKPISDCGLTPEQQIYAIRVDIAQYKAAFSLDGHWEDAASGFTLDLYQDWKQIYGRHTAVAQDGNKIDSLDVSIDGRLNGKVATVRFQSSFATEPGTAEITYVDVNTIQWKIVDPPDGEYYLPAESTLTRQ